MHFIFLFGKYQPKLCYWVYNSIKESYKTFDSNLQILKSLVIRTQINYVQQIASYLKLNQQLGREDREYSTVEEQIFPWTIIESHKLQNVNHYIES